MRTIIASSLLLLLPVAAFCEEASEVISRLQERYESVHTVEAAFTQEVLSKGMKAPQRSGGKVWFKKPGKMRWEYSTTGDEIVSNGLKIWVWQPDLKQVIEKATDSSAPSIATDFLSGVGNLKKDFEASIAGEKDGVIILELKPRQATAQLKRLKLDIDKDSFMVVGTTVEDSFGTRTIVKFKDIKTNIPLKDSLFEFKAPKGSTIVRP